MRFKSARAAILLPPPACRTQPQDALLRYTARFSSFDRPNRLLLPGRPWDTQPAEE